MNSLRKVAVLTSTALLGITVVMWCMALSRNNREKLISFGPNYHVGVMSFRNVDARISFFNDEEYGAYRGSIVGLEGGPPYIKHGFGSFFGIYYRYFRWPDGTELWTLLLSLWYPTILFSVLPIAWLLSLPAMAPYRPRFSLRTLLLFTTLVALALGLIVWASR